jgi:hypothetical protein
MDRRVSVGPVMVRCGTMTTSARRQGRRADDDAGTAWERAEMVGIRHDGGTLRVYT